MKIEKQDEIMMGIFFFGGIALCIYTLRSTDGIFSIIGIGMLLLAAFIGGKKEGCREFNNMHYTSLENEAKKRREKEEELSKKVHEEMEEYEKAHPDSN